MTPLFPTEGTSKDLRHPHCRKSAHTEQDGPIYQDQKESRTVYAPPGIIGVQGIHWETKSLYVDPHIVYTLELRHAHRQQETTTRDLIAVRWSSLVELRSVLSGYVKALLAFKLPPRLRFAFQQGSNLNEEVAQERLLVIQQYLSEILANPKFQGNVHLQAFLDKGRRCAAQGKTAVKHETILVPRPPSPQEESKKEETTSSTCTKSDTSCPPTSFLLPPGEAETPPQPKQDQASKQQPVVHISRTRKASTFMALSHRRCWPWCQNKKLSPAEAEENVMRALSLFLFDSGMFQELLAPHDLLHLSQTCKEWRSIQLLPFKELRPRCYPVETPEPMQHTVPPRSSSCLDDDLPPLSATALRQHKREQESYEDGYDAFIKALKEGKQTQDLQFLGFHSEKKDWRPRLTSQAFCKMTPYFHNLPSLVHLDLRRNGLDSEAAIALADGLRRMPNLLRLDLSSNPIGDAGAIALAAALSHLPKLQTLLLENCQVGPVGGQALADAFPHLRSLTSFHFGGCSGFVPVIEALDTLRELRLLRLSNIPLRDASAEQPGGAYKLAQKLRCLTKLRDISLFRCYIGELGMDSMSISFQRLYYLQSIEMDGYCYSERTASFLSAYLLCRCLQREHDVNFYGDPVTRFLIEDVISEERSSKEQKRLGPYKKCYVSGFQHEWPGSPQKEEEKEKRIMAEYERRLQQQQRQRHKRGC